MGFPDDACGKGPPYQCKRLKRADSVPGLGRLPEGEHGNTLQYSCLENPIHRGPWGATVHRVIKSGTQLKQFSMHTQACI